MARALRNARAGVGPAFAAVTVPLPLDLDPSAVVLAGRRPGDRFLCLEQPERAGFALAGLGEVARLEAEGEGRASELARRARRLGARMVADEPAAARVVTSSCGAPA